MFNKKNDSNMVSIVSAFALGSLIGAAITLLMAPQSGAETRDALRDRTMELRDRAMDTADETRDRAEKTMDELAKKARQETDDLKKRGKDAVDNATKNY
jgi:gas vesicle protein